MSDGGRTIDRDELLARIDLAQVLDAECPKLVPLHQCHHRSRSPALHDRLWQIWRLWQCCVLPGQGRENAMRQTTRTASKQWQGSGNHLLAKQRIQELLQEE